MKKVTEQVQALFRSASILFALSFDRPPVHAAVDSAGVTLVLGGREPGRIVRLSSLGEFQWQHDVTRTFSEGGAYPPEFNPREDGTVMIVYAVAFSAESYFPRDPPQGADGMAQEGEGEAVRYLVLKSDGSIAIDDTLGIIKDLSPDGQYYYSFHQEGREIVLRRTSGNRWRIRIPPREDQSLPEIPNLRIGFADRRRVVVTETVGKTKRTGIIDLLSHGALWTELEFPPTYQPNCCGSYQIGIGQGGELIYAGSQVFAFDQDGKLIWNRQMTEGNMSRRDWSGEKPISSPRWVVCAADQGLAAVFTGSGVGIIKEQTGEVLDSHLIDGDIMWIFEASFENHLLNVVGQRTSLNRPYLIQAVVGLDGTITSWQEHEVVMRGLGSSAISCIVAQGDSTQPWVVAGFKK